MLPALAPHSSAHCTCRRTTKCSQRAASYEERRAERGSRRVGCQLDRLRPQAAQHRLWKRRLAGVSSQIVLDIVPARPPQCTDAARRGGQSARQIWRQILRAWRGICLHGPPARQEAALTTHRLPPQRAVQDALRDNHHVSRLRADVQHARRQWLVCAQPTAGRNDSGGERWCISRSVRSAESHSNTRRAGTHRRRLRDRPAAGRRRSSPRRSRATRRAGSRT